MTDEQKQHILTVIRKSEKAGSKYVTDEYIAHVCGLDVREVAVWLAEQQVAGRLWFDNLERGWVIR